MCIKVLMVVPDLEVSNGVATFAMNYYRRIDHDRIRMDFACFKESNSPYNNEILENGDHILILPPAKSLFHHIKRCREIVSEGRYDIIHNNSLLVTVPLMKAAVGEIPVRILHSHNSRFGETRFKEIRNRLFFSFLIKTSNHYAACSESAGRLFFGEKPFTIIPNVIDTECFRYDEEKRVSVRKRESCENNRVIIAVGRLAHQKNPFFAFDVIEKVMETRKDAVFWWIGDGELLKQAEEYIHSRHMDEYIKLFGSREDVSDLLQAADVFFLPSAFEGLGIACLEAQASGLPCIVSSEFPKEVNITDNVTFVSLSESKDLWAKMILSMLDNKRCDYSDKVNCSMYSCRKSGHVLEDYYNSLIGMR